MVRGVYLKARWVAMRACAPVMINKLGLPHYKTCFLVDGRNTFPANTAIQFILF